MNVNDAQTRKNKGSGRGCLIALGIFGAVLIVSVLVGGIVIYKVLDSPEGRKIVTAVADTTKLTQEAMRAPGTPELRALGCTQAMVMDAERMAGIITPFLPDAGRRTEIAEKTMILCQMGAVGKVPPTCEDVAKTYLAAVPVPPGDFVIMVNAQGDSKPKCQKRYSQAGVALDP